MPKIMKSDSLVIRCYCFANREVLKTGKLFLLLKKLPDLVTGYL